MRSPRRLQHEVPQGFRPCLAGGISQHEVHAAKLVWFLPSVPRVKLAEEPPDLRLLPDLAFDKVIQHAFEPRAAASGGAEDPDHVLGVHAPGLLAPLKGTSQPGASEARSVVQACRAEIDVPKCGTALYRPFYAREPEQLRGLLGDCRSKGVHYVNKFALPFEDSREGLSSAYSLTLRISQGVQLDHYEQGSPRTLLRLSVEFI